MDSSYVKRSKAVTPFFNLIPESMHRRTVIAGGAVVSFPKAKDVDIWILSCGSASCMAERAVRSTIREHLHDFFGDEDFFTPEWEEKTIDVDYANADGRVLFTTQYLGKKVQILGTRFTTVTELLTHFDLSVHQAALLPGSGAIVELCSTTQVGEVIRVTNYHSPEHTFARARKLCQRYGTTVHTMDLSRLLLAQPTAPEEVEG